MDPITNKGDLSLQNVTIQSHSKKFEFIAQELAEGLGIAIQTGEEQPRSGFVLEVNDDKNHTNDDFVVSLSHSNDRKTQLLVDFTDGRNAYRRYFGGGHKQALARALGLKNGTHPVVFDATAGLGKDAFVMASLGCEVHLLERHALIHALLTDGLRRALKHPSTAQISERMHLYHLDAITNLSQLSEKYPPTYVYLDPMYPTRNKSALVKKDMQFLQALITQKDQNELLLSQALQHAQQRVVVKRPRHADTLPGPSATHCILSKNTRYDVYMIRRPE